MDLLHGGDKVINSDDLGGAMGLSAHAGMISIKSIERSNFCGRLDFIVICEFSEEEPSGPVFFVMIREGVNVLLNFLIGTFSLTISLGVKGCGEASFDTQEALQLCGELRCELRASV